MTTATLHPLATTFTTGCCPPFDPSTFHQREVTYRDEAFVKLEVPSVFHVPIGLGRKIVRAQRLIDAAGAAVAQPLMLSDERSPFGSDLYIRVAKPVPGLESATLPGTYMTRVYDGPWKQMGKWAADTARWVKSTGRTAEKLYFGYTTCPACAKAYGHNYVVVFARVA